MDRFPPLAWLAIAIIVGIGTAVNLWMVALLRSKDRHSPAAAHKSPPRGLSPQSMQKLAQVLRSPFGEEQKNLAQLSKMVQDLKDKEENSSQ
jgi:hypothetical protein